MKAIQEFYDDAVSVCYGCGRLNEHGLHIQSYWNGQKAICTFEPQAYHLAVPGYTYGGLLASLIDCHSIGTAAAATYAAEGRPPGSEPTLRYVTAALNVSYLHPTPLEETLVLSARVIEFAGRKARVACSVLAAGKETVRAEVVTVRMPEHWLP